MKAELAPSRRSVRCPDCRRHLAYRTRLPDGSHVIEVDQWWRQEMVKMEDRIFGRGRLIKPWKRLEDGRMPSSITLPPEGRGRRSRLGLPATMVCGCGRDIDLDAVTLDAAT